jgi:hypothetical protein
MTALNIKAFRGQVPRVSDRLLPSNFAVRALNCKITSGKLEPLAGLGLVHTSLAAAIKTLFRYRHFDDGGFADNWLVWPTDVDVVRSPLANDDKGRFFFSGEDIEPRMSTYALAIGAAPYPSAWYALGLSNPVQVTGVAASGGTAPVDSRSYVHTFVTALGEESGPSPPSAVVSGNTNGTWALSNLQVAPPNSGALSAVANNSPTTGRVRITLNTVVGLQEFDTVNLAGVLGMTDLNRSHRLLAVNAATNTVDVALTTAQTYTSGGTWSRLAPHNTVGMTKRIYRTNAGTTGAAFQFVAEIAVAQTTYTDAVTGALLGEVLPTLSTLAPPKNLTSLTSLPNGCLVGLSSNELCFSDPYLPHSWPIGNRYSFSGRGVALSATGNSVLVLTDTSPILFSGSDPEAMSPTTLETYAPCVAKRGVVNVGGGCLYPSFDGLWLASPGRAENLTRKLYREEEWSSLGPSSFVAAFHDGRYYACFAVGAERRILVLDMNEPDSVVEVTESADALHRNEYDGELYIAQGAKVLMWDAAPGHAYNSDWKSATVQLAKPTNFAVAQVYADFARIVPLNTNQIDANALLMQNADAVAGYLGGNELLQTEVCGSFIVPVTPITPGAVQFTLFADGKPVFSRGVTSSSPFRLPAGYRSDTINVGLAVSIPAYSVVVAESMAELAAL